MEKPARGAASSALLAIVFWSETGHGKNRNLFQTASRQAARFQWGAWIGPRCFTRWNAKHGKAGYDTARQFERHDAVEAGPVDRELAEMPPRF